MKLITGAQIRAARAMLRWSAEKLAEEARLGVATVRRADAADGVPPITVANAHAIRVALETRVVFIPQNGDGPGVRLKGIRDLPKQIDQEPDYGPDEEAPDIGDSEDDYHDRFPSEDE